MMEERSARRSLLQPSPRPRALSPSTVSNIVTFPPLASAELREFLRTRAGLCEFTGCLQATRGRIGGHDRGNCANEVGVICYAACMLAPVHGVFGHDLHLHGTAVRRRAG